MPRTPTRLSTFAAALAAGLALAALSSAAPPRHHLGIPHYRYVCRHGAHEHQRKACAAWRYLHGRQLAYAERDWLAAVRLAGRVFPGTEGWLRSCSRPESEGGWGRWVPNSQGSGAGGWLQFLSGTFYSNVDRAFAEARAVWRLPVPSRYRSWYSRVGQALTGASMLVHGQRGEWSGSGC